MQLTKCLQCTIRRSNIGIRQHSHGDDNTLTHTLIRIHKRTRSKNHGFREYLKFVLLTREQAAGS